MKSLLGKLGVIIIGLVIFSNAEVWGADWKLPPPPPSPSPKGDMVINDFKVYPVANIPKPAKGVEFIDPVFHTKITRVIDSMAETGSRATYAGGCRHQGGCDLYRIQKLGRWKSISMVMRYAHHYPVSLRPGIEVLDQFRKDSITNLSQSKEKGVTTESQPLDRFGSGG